MDLTPTASQLMVVREANNTNTLYWSKPLRGCGYHIRGENGSGSNSSPILKSGIVGESSNSWNHAGTTSWTYRIEVFGIDGSSVFTVGTWHDRYKAIISSVNPNYGAMLSTSCEFFIVLLNDTSGGSGSYPVVNGNNVTIQYSLNAGSWTDATIAWQPSPVSAWKVSITGLTAGSVNSYSFRANNSVYIGNATTTISYGPNLLVNGDFESTFSSGVPVSWIRVNDANVTSCSSAQETTNKYYGNNSTKLTQTYVNTQGVHYIHQVVSVTVGQSYRLAASTMGSRTGDCDFIVAAWGDATENWDKGFLVASQSPIATTWTLRSLSGNAPSNSTRVQVRAGCDTRTSGTWSCYLDNIYFGKAA